MIAPVAGLIKMEMVETVVAHDEAEVTDTEMADEEAVVTAVVVAPTVAPGQGVGHLIAREKCIDFHHD